MKTADVYELINDRTKTAVENAKRAERHHLQASCMLPLVYMLILLLMCIS